MGNAKKISPNEVGLEVGLVLSKFFFKTEHLHFGFWPDDLEISIDNLKKSQDYHSEKIINSIPSDVHTILDVGSGSGGLAEKLVEKNYKVECVSPSHFLSDAIETKLVGKVRVHRSTFENLEIKTKYDLILFSESFQYVNIQKSFEKIPSLLDKNGKLLICDFFRQPGTGTKPLGGGHDWKVFQDYLSNFPFNNILDVDITRETARTYDLIDKIINDVALPVRDLSSTYLSSQYPGGMRLLKWFFKKKINRMNRIYFKGNMKGEMFNKLKTYRILLYDI